MQKTDVTENRFLGVVWFLFVLLLIFNMLNHEMWRDELDSWLVTRDNDLSGIMNYLPYSGHPALWYLAVELVQVFTDHPMGMQIINLLFVAMAVLILLKWAPFSKLEKILLTFSYYFLYEYGTLCRNYGLSLLLLIAFLSLYRVKDKYYILMGLILALLANVHVLSMLLSVLLGAYWLSEEWTNRRRQNNSLISSLPKLSAFAIISLGILVFYLHAMPSAEFSHNPAKNVAVNLAAIGNAFSLIYKSFVPIPKAVFHFWNSQILPGFAHLPLALALFILTTLGFMKRPLRAAFYALGMAGYMLFFIFIYPGFLRHHGFIFFVFFSFYWMARIDNVHGSLESLDENLAGRLQRIQMKLFTFVCAAQLVAGIMASYQDWRHPFSANREVVRYLQTAGLDKDIIVGDLDFIASPVSAWLHNKIYYPMSSDYGSYIEWSAKRQNINFYDQAEVNAYVRFVVESAFKLCDETQRDVTLLLSYALDQAPLAAFTESICGDEVYYLYRIKYTGPR